MGAAKRGSVRQRDLPAPATDPDPVAHLDRVDAAWAGGVGMLALGLFAYTFSSRVALGDAPESVSGIRSLGILHAPGYPAYVLLGRLWATLLPIGSWAARVNAFSVVCSAAAVALVYVLARLFGAAHVGAALGALALATSVSFWFNAGFAKHYGLTALLVTLVAVLGVSWVRFGGAYRLVVAGALVGLGSGASWQLMAFVVIAVVALVLFGGRRITLREAGAAIGCAVIVTAALWSFVVVRAGQDPAIDFGRPTTAARLVELIEQKDFLAGPQSPHGVRALAKAPHRAVAYANITVRELSAGAIIVAFVGGIFVLRRRRWADASFLGILFFANAFGVIFVAGLEHEQGITSGVIVGGFLIDLMIALAVLVGLGATELANAAGGWFERSRRDSSSTRVRGLVFGVLAIVVLVPSLIVHEPYASHRKPAYADRYARRVLAALPPNAVLLTYGWEYGQPIRYRQIVFGERPDVTVFSDAEAKLAWYREGLRRTDPAIAPEEGHDYSTYVSRFVETAMHSDRPVFVDMSIVGAIGDAWGLRVQGDIAQLTRDPSIEAKGSVREQSRVLHQAQERDGWLTGDGTKFPNRAVALFEARADVVMAKLAVNEHDLESATTQLRDAVRILPDIDSNRAALQLLESGDPGAADAVLALTGSE